jgi:hypothetical protein
MGELLDTKLDAKLAKQSDLLNAKLDAKLAKQSELFATKLAKQSDLFVAKLEQECGKLSQQIENMLETLTLRKTHYVKNQASSPFLLSATFREA